MTWAQCFTQRSVEPHSCSARRASSRRLASRKSAALCSATSQVFCGLTTRIHSIAASTSKSEKADARVEKLELEDFSARKLAFWSERLRTYSGKRVLYLMWAVRVCACN